MPKHGFLTPKAIGNRIKSKGLQKLRWYCQCCQKQCRDQNGFKCHLTSEGHLRQMKLVAENPNKIIEDFSKEFEKNYVELLSRRFGVRRVNANHVYMELIAEKSHVHMNSTMWATLQDFVKYLGRTGVCVVDQTEKGWYIQWIDRDPAKMRMQQAADARERSKLSEEERIRRRLEKQAREAERQGLLDVAPTPTGLRRDQDGSSVKLSLVASGGGCGGSGGGGGALGGGAGRGAGGATVKRKSVSAGAAFAFGSLSDGPPSGKKARGGGGGGGGGGGLSSKPMSAMDQILWQEKMRRKADKDKALRQAEAATLAVEAAAAARLAAAQSQAQAQAQAPADAWVRVGVVVKVLNKKVGGGKYYKKKGEVVAVQDDYVATLRLKSKSAVSGFAKLMIDQDDLETVIPALGRRVAVVGGKHRGAEGTLEAVRERNFTASVKLEPGRPGAGAGGRSGGGGAGGGTLLEGLAFEDICKLAGPGPAE